MSLDAIFWLIVSSLDVILYLLVPVVIAAGAGWFIIKKLRELDEIERIEGHEADRVRCLGEVLTGPGWVDGHGFEWVGCYRIIIPRVKMRFSAWKQVGSHTYLCVYRTKASELRGTTNVDIVSIFGRAYGLTTAGTDDGPMFPIRRGCYKQHFQTRDIDRLWALHTEAEAIVAPANLRDIDPLREQSLDKMLIEAVKDELAFIRSIRFWPLRVPWWYFINRPRHLNKTVVQRMGRRERQRHGIA